MKKIASLLTALTASLCFSPAGHAQPATARDAVPAAQPPPSADAPSAVVPEGATPTPEPAPSPNTARTVNQTTTAPAASPVLNFGEVSEKPSRVLPRRRDGFYMRGSSGPGVLSLSGDGPTRSASLSALGSTGRFSIGGSVMPGLVLAGTLRSTTVQTTFKGGPFRSATIAADGSQVAASHQALAAFTELGLLVDWYPNPAAGWHAGISGGLGLVGIVNNADDSTLFGVSPAGTVFGGYDWAIGGDWSLGLSLEASGAPAATMKHGSGGGDAGYRLTPLSLSLQVSILYF